MSKSRTFVRIILPIILIYLGIQVYYYLFYSAPGYVLPLTWDKFGYYLYLPSVFVYHDILHLHFAEAMMHKYDLCDGFYQAHLYGNGNYVLSYTLGLAILEFPFFLLGHLAAYLLGYPMDGFALPYQFCITLCGTFYTAIGLWFTYRNLRFFFEEKFSLLLLGVAILCTNYLYYSLFENGMTHSYLFAMYAVVLYCTIMWYQEQKLKYILGLGVASGIAIVMRPSEILIVLVPVLYGLKDKDALIERVRLFIKRFGNIALYGCIIFFIGLVQLLYWKFATGHWLYNSYKETGQSFDFIHPYLVKGIFSLKKGWLVYTPVMMLSFVGLFFVYQKARPIFIMITTYMLINIYVVFSWCQWDYGGGFGARALVQSYALLIIPVGFAVRYLFSKPQLRYCVIGFIVLCAMLNVLQTIQYAKGMISPGGMNSYSYTLLFGKLSMNEDKIKAYEGLDKLDAPIFSIDTVMIEHFDTSALNIDSSQKALLLGQDESILYKGAISPRKGMFVRISARGWFNQICYDYKNLPSMKLVFLDQDNHVKAEKTIKIEPLINANHSKLNVDYLGEPKAWAKFNFVIKRPVNNWGIQLSAFNNGGNKVMIDDIVIENIASY